MCAGEWSAGAILICLAVGTLLRLRAQGFAARVLYHRCARVFLLNAGCAVIRSYGGVLVSVGELSVMPPFELFEFCNCCVIDCLRPR